MKDYSLKINGNQYDISIEDVNEESTMANVTVNGVAYEVEIVGEQASKMKKPQVVPAPKAAGLSVTPTTAAPSAPKAAQAAAGGPGLQVKSPLPGTILSVNVKEGDRVAPRQTLFRARGDEDGEQHRCRTRRCCQIHPRPEGRYRDGR